MDELNKTRSILNAFLICAQKMLLLFKFLNISLTKRYRLQMYVCTTGGTQRNIWSYACITSGTRWAEHVIAPFTPKPRAIPYRYADFFEAHQLTATN